MQYGCVEYYYGRVHFVLMSSGLLGLLIYKAVVLLGPNCGVLITWREVSVGSKWRGGGGE